MATENNSKENNSTGNTKVFQLEPSKNRTLRINKPNGGIYITGTSDNQLRLRVNHPFRTAEVEFRGENIDVRVENVDRRKVNFEVSFEDEATSDPDPVASDEDVETMRSRRPETGDSLQDAIGKIGEMLKEVAREVAEEGEFSWGRKAGEFRFEAKDFDFDKIVNKFSGKFRQFGQGQGGLYIEMPSWLSLELKTASGEVIIRNLSSSVRVRNASSYTYLENLSGNTYFKTASGNLEATQLQGMLEAKIVSGKANLKNCALSELDLSVVSGDCWLDTTLTGNQRNTYRINSTSGNVNLNLPGNSHADLEFYTLSGRVRMPQRVDQQYGRGNRGRPGMHRERLDINGGGSKVLVTSVSGNINLQFDGQPFKGEQGSWGIPPIPPIPPMPPVPPVPPVGGEGWGWRGSGVGRGEGRDWRGNVPPHGEGRDWRGGGSNRGENRGWGRPTPPFGEAQPTPNDPPAAPGNWPKPTSSEPEAIITPPPPMVTIDDTILAQGRSFKAERLQPQEVAPGVEANEEPARPPATSPGEGYSEGNGDSPPENRQLEILRQIERGELSVEEGLRRLNEVN